MEEGAQGTFSCLILSILFFLFFLFSFHCCCGEAFIGEGGQEGEGGRGREMKGEGRKGGRMR